MKDAVAYNHSPYYKESLSYFLFFMIHFLFEYFLGGRKRNWISVADPQTAYLKQKRIKVGQKNSITSFNLLPFLIQPSLNSRFLLNLNASVVVRGKRCLLLERLEIRLTRGWLCYLFFFLDGTLFLIITCITKFGVFLIFRE